MKGHESLIMTIHAGFSVSFSGRERSSQDWAKNNNNNKKQEGNNKKKAGRQHNTTLHSTYGPRALWRSLEEKKKKSHVE